MTLTDEHPTGSFPLDPDTVAAAPAILSLSVTKVVNPAAAPFTVAVYLASEGDRGEEQKVLVGDFSLYPADRPAGFLLRASGAFQQLRAAAPRPPPGAVRLLIEMKRMRATRAPAALAVTVAPPRWRNDAHPQRPGNPR